MSRGKVSVIRDVAVAVAAAKCWMARWNGGKTAKRLTGIPTDSFHPTDCGFCDYPTDLLINAVSEFRQWAGLEPSWFMDETQYMRAEVEAFLSTSNAEQRRLVAKAQGYLDSDE